MIRYDSWNTEKLQKKVEFKKNKFPKFWSTRRKKWEKTRHKTITVLVSFAGNVPRFLVVRDRRFHDWTFVTGGCRRKEINNPIRCALRELKEETKGIININEGKYSYYFFKTDKIVPNFMFIYHVYIIEVDTPLVEQQYHVSEFQHQMVNPTHLPLKCYNETDNLLWVTFKELKLMEKWHIIGQHVLDNPDFLAMISTLNRRIFNVQRKQYEKQKLYSRPTCHPPGFFCPIYDGYRAVVQRHTNREGKITENEDSRSVKFSSEVKRIEKEGTSS